MLVPLKAKVHTYNHIFRRIIIFFSIIISDILFYIFLPANIFIYVLRVLGCMHSHIYGKVRVLDKIMSFKVATLFALFGLVFFLTRIRI